MSIERKLEQIRASDLENKTQIERYQTILEELLSRKSQQEYQIVLSHCQSLLFFLTRLSCSARG
jgi:hypothetical protein